MAIVDICNQLLDLRVLIELRSGVDDGLQLTMGGIKIFGWTLIRPYYRNPRLYLIYCIVGFYASCSFSVEKEQLSRIFESS